MTLQLGSVLRLGIGPLGVSWGAVCTIMVQEGCLEEAVGQNSMKALPQQYTLLRPCSRDGLSVPQGRWVQGPGRGGLVLSSVKLTCPETPPWSWAGGTLATF